MKEIQIVDLLRYYVCWNDTEKVLIEGIQNYDLKAFYNYLVYMKIIRNFKKGSANQILEIAKTFDNKTAEDVCRLSDKLYSKKVLAKNNKNALVASSKILWAFNHDRIIIDSINKKKLKLNTENINDYSEFCSMWVKEYERQRNNIDKIIDKHNLLKIDAIFAEEWFKKRVFDLYLIYLK
ncbi:hypothetical protein [uncultured Treponema sp.]|uniref:hypothetical protein n=1 Tax=uncultured Treponema sp. TaxID=162155 RepID=UPI002595297D|nr:hypothetical protein [uncultured Treponema sp.]